MSAKKDLVLRAPELVDRRTGLGGTDVAAIVGLNPYRKPLDVWAAKLGLIDDVVENRAMKWGKILERPIREEYERERGVTLVVNFGEPCRHPERAWQIGTPDATLPSDKLVVEVKTAGLRQVKRWGEPGTDQVPDEYLIQTAWYMSLLDYDEAHIAALIGGQDFRVYQIKRDKDLEATLLEQAENFWNAYVLSNEPPPMAASEGASAYLRKQFPRERVPLRPATNAEADLVAALAEVRLGLDRAETVKEELENRIKVSIGDATGIEGPNFRATWKAVETKRTDWKAVSQALNPPIELVKKNTNVSESRRFLLRLDGEDK